jgi:hypothetical protein
MVRRLSTGLRPSPDSVPRLGEQGSINDAGLASYPVKFKNRSSRSCRCVRRVLRTNVQVRSSAFATCSTSAAATSPEPSRTTTNETRTETEATPSADRVGFRSQRPSQGLWSGTQPGLEDLASLAPTAGRCSSTHPKSPNSTPLTPETAPCPSLFSTELVHPS